VGGHRADEGGVGGVRLDRLGAVEDAAAAPGEPGDGCGREQRG
jgi:hypothetical protein